MRPKILLLINLGTPRAPTRSEVARYLREFLMDPHVIDLPWIWRWPLVNGMIVPRRSASSAHAYQQTWTERGSPLLFHSEALAQRVRGHLSSDWEVCLAMRYAEPSIRASLEEIVARHGTDPEIYVLPLYPHDADSTVKTSLLEVTKRARPLGLKNLHPLPVFFDRDFFIDTWAEIIRKSRERSRWEHLLFSYHGLPERHLKKVEPEPGNCLNYESCCAPFNERNRSCYRAQCLETSRRIVQRLQPLLADSPLEFSSAFQSRLGRDRWIPPYTEESIRELAQKGVRRLAVACPSFVADCLETIEEIGMRARDAFIAEGGEEFTLIPCPNDHEILSQGLAQWVHRFSLDEPHKDWTNAEHPRR